MTELPLVIVAMGVSGAGKSTFGTALAAVLERTFLDADDLHSPANKATMAAGVPLTDDDRSPWLDDVATAARQSAPLVVACSALKRRYRDRLRLNLPSLAFIELDVPRKQLTQRLTERTHEFMSPTLLQSQLEELEPLDTDEPGVRLPYGNTMTPQTGAQAAVDLLEALWGLADARY